MHRLDPGCPETQRLLRQRATQRALLLDGLGPGSTLAQKVDEAFSRSAHAHLQECTRCRAYVPPAPPARTWRDWLPWNWGKRKAAARPVEVVVVPAPASAAPRPAPPLPEAPQNTRHHRPGRTFVPATRATAPVPTPQDEARRVLGVEASASPEAIRAAYRALAMQYHPDKVAHLAPDFRAVAEKKMALLNRAYEILTETAKP